jgi:hypothetical protein
MAVKTQNKSTKPNLKKNLLKTATQKRKRNHKDNVNPEEDIDFEEEFGMLYEWTSHLSLDHLQDYTFAN